MTSGELQAYVNGLRSGFFGSNRDRGRMPIDMVDISINLRADMLSRADISPAGVEHQRLEEAVSSGGSAQNDEPLNVQDELRIDRSEKTGGEFYVLWNKCAMHSSSAAVVTACAEYLWLVPEYLQSLVTDLEKGLLEMDEYTYL